MKTYLRKSFAASLAMGCLATAHQASADTFLKTVMRTGAVVIQDQEMPGSTDTAKTWISAHRAYQDHGDGTAALYLVDDSVFYIIDHNQKTVLESDLTKGLDFAAMIRSQVSDTNSAGKPLTKAERQAQEDSMAQMTLMLQAMMAQSTVEVKATGDKRTIGQWETEKYTLDLNIAGMQSKGEIWATTSSPAVYQIFQRLAYAQMAASPGFDKLLDEIAKIKGVTVLSTSTMSIMGYNVAVETELLEMAEADPPAGIYELPAGYTRTTP